MKSITIAITFLVICPLFIQCASSQKMDKIAPVKVENPYFERWSTDDEKGLTIYIPVEESSELVLEHAYFKFKKIALSKEVGTSVYVGKYTFPKGKSNDLVMSSDPKEEFNNTPPPGIERIPFQLSGNECVISYTKDGVQSHFKIENIQEK